MYKRGILRRIYGSPFFKGTILILIIEMLIQIGDPLAIYALTSGPTQPEVEGFQPIGITDMVDPFTGDFSYNVPLMTVGNYPLNLSYQSGVGMDDEASWAGLGWNVHTGCITRQMRGLPDDFWGDEVTRNVYLRDNLTIGAKVMLGFETFGLDLSDYGVNLGVGFDVNYNTYKGVGLTSIASASVNTQAASGGGMNLGLTMAAGPEGLNLSPNISFSQKFSSQSKESGGSASLGFGFNINSRAGLTGMTLTRGVDLSGTKTSRAKYNKGEKDKKTYEKMNASYSVASHSSSMNFGQPTFSPQIDLPMINSAGSGRFKIGGAVFGQDIDAAITGYGSRQKLAKNKLVNPAYGYIYAEKGEGNPDALHDFNREKDGTFTKEKKNLPITNQTYDLYNISAQGLGGTFRAYRNDAGYIYDKRANSPSTSIDFGFEIGPGNLVDFGLDFTANVLESESKAWTAGNGAGNALKFRAHEADNIRENFHFKMTGEKNVDPEPAYNNTLRNNKPVAFELDKNSGNFEVASYNKFVESNGSKHAFNQPNRAIRQPRNTAVYHFTVNQIRRAYPWKEKYISTHAKGHHIAEIVIIQPDGTRYVFGLAVYNVTQREVSFNAGAGGSAAALSGDESTGLINSGANYNNIKPGTKRGIDHFYDETITPAYAHSWMLTEILSPDYVDVTGNGPTPDDLGNYTKFNYGHENAYGTASPDINDFQWRTPTTGTASASYMQGLRTDLTDDKGSIIYGIKDVWYVHSIESKTQIAVFHTSDRDDALGANFDGILQTGTRLKKLDKIELFSMQEYVQPNHTPVPIKTAHFEYDYALCPNTPNSNGGGSGHKGKLTLKKVYFTYKGSRAGYFSPYEFSYRESASTGNQPTFSYQYGKADRWGILKPQSQQPAGLTHTDWPYATQNKASRDDYSSAWHLSRIKLPSGGEINIKYESDDYGFVQDKDAMRMFKIKGLASNANGADTDNIIFPYPLGPYKDYVIIDLNDPNTTTTEQFRQKYLLGYGKGNHENNPVKHLYYRFLINVNGLNTPSNPSAPPEYEYISGYCKIDLNGCGINSDGDAYLKIERIPAKMTGVWANVSPFAYSAWQFSRISTPRKAFGQPEPTDDAMDQIVQTIVASDFVTQIIQFIQGPNGRMNAQGHGSRLNLAGCWVRLLEPDKNKLGGNCRVKEITISDQWNEMSSSEPTAKYGQEFSYVDEHGRTTGVAAYEPGIGADENPFRVPTFYSGPKQILIPEERFYLEEPFGETFFPGPSVGYSKVTIKDKAFDNNVTLNRTGKTVNEFYTAFDFPTDYDYTDIDIQSREQGVLAALLSPNKRKYMTASQGYTIILNDMHGKPKSVNMYAEGESTPFSYTKYHYKMSNGKLNNMVDVIDRDGKVYQKEVGVEMDFIADMREQTTYGETGSVTGNLATMLFGMFGPVTIPSIFFSLNTDKTRFRSASTTKVVQQFGIQDVTETFDKGAYVETKITAFDAKTGMPLVQELNNEYKDKYYKLDYPAHWSYTGMRQASENIGYTFSFLGSVLDDPQHDVLEPGDEVLPIGRKVYFRTGTVTQPGNANNRRYWVALDENSGDKYLIDDQGMPISVPGPNQEYFTVIRSGHRNMQSSSVGSVTTVLSPIRQVSTERKVVVDAASRVIAASVVEFAEHWKTDRGFTRTFCDSTITITYDPKMLAIINILNNVIESNEPFYTDAYADTGLDVSGSSGSEFSLLFPGCNQPPAYYQNVNLLCTPGGGPATECCPPVWAGWGIQGLEPNLTYNGLAFYLYTDINESACSCSRMRLWAMDPCPQFTSTDWNDIAYFKDECTITQSQGLAYGIASSGNVYGLFVILTGVMQDGSERYFLFNYGCWEMENIIDKSYDCDTVCTDVGDTINPYLYGILGNWRTKGDYFFMGDRNNTDASTAENLRTDGYLSGFKSYWKAPASSTGVWVRNTPAVLLGDYENWNRKTEMTIYSPYGFDLENKNPLPAYSSAQYGYYNTLPTAVVNNAQQKEIGFDGFEDYYPWITFPECDKAHFKYESYKASLSQEQAHTGLWSMGISDNGSLVKIVPVTQPYAPPAPREVPYVLDFNDVLGGFSPNMHSTESKKFVLCFWAKPEVRSHTVFDYTGIAPTVKVDGVDVVVSGSLKKSKLINDWQRYELYFTVPDMTTSEDLEISITNTTGQRIFVDDIRVHPFDANMKSFVYHMFDFKYMAQLDENNFATFYEYDEEGKLVRVKKETERGIMTLQENRTTMYTR